MSLMSIASSHLLSVCLQMETSVQTILAKMEPCAQTAWEATIVFASRVSQGSTVKQVRRRCPQVLCVILIVNLLFILSKCFSVSMMQTRLCALWKKTKAAPSSVNQATHPTSVPAPVDGSSAAQTRISVRPQVRLSCLFPLLGETRRNK